MKKIYIKTYGCQMNVYDSSRIVDIFITMGYEQTDSPENADVIVINTCHIREKASEKTFSEIGKLKKIKEKTGAILILAGCVVQASDDIIKSRVPFVDIAVGPQSYHKIPEMLKNLTGKTKVNAEFLMDKFTSLPMPQKSSYINYVAIQEGCDKFCSYCVVPFTRGVEYSRPVESVLDEIKAMRDAGAVDIMLLGQNVNAYNGDGSDGKQKNLAFLIKKVAQIEGIERIKYVTSYPSQMDEQLINAHGEVKKLMPFLHLPIQSGANNVLKLMNRKYNVEEYLKIIEKLRNVRDDIALSSDFIVGFPGETEKDFEETLELIDTVKYAQSFSFKFSPRAGTRAFEITEGIVDEQEKNNRLLILQEKLLNQQKEFNVNCIGKNLQVLIENQVKNKQELFGRSQYMQTVNIKADKSLVGKILDVKITNANRNTLKGEIV